MLSFGLPFLTFNLSSIYTSYARNGLLYGLFNLLGQSAESRPRVSHFTLEAGDDCHVIADLGGEAGAAHAEGQLRLLEPPRELNPVRQQVREDGWVRTSFEQRAAMDGSRRRSRLAFRGVGFMLTHSRLVIICKVKIVI